MIKLLARIFVFLVLWTSTALSLNQAAFERQLDEFLEGQDFNGVILVAQGDKVLFEKAYGLSNFEKKTPTTPETLYIIASLTKQFTGAAIAKLIQEGKVNTDKTLSTYLPGFKAPWASKITINMLLAHQSGVPDGSRAVDRAIKKTGERPSIELFLKLIEDRPLEFEPGAQYKYSNTGYNLLGIVVQKVSQQPLAQFYQQNIFTPAGMNTAFYAAGQLYSEVLKAHPKLAMAYVSPKKGDERAALADFSMPMAAGGIVATARDLWKWNNALYGGKILSPEGSKIFLKGRSETGRNSEYASGVIIAQNPQYGLQYVHNGAARSYNTWLTYFPKEKVTIVFVSNYSQVKGLPKQLLKLVNDELVLLKP
jgi:CubicO group peptidase (beta-lactamase class C family)